MPSNSCVLDLPSLADPVSLFAQNLIHEAKLYINKALATECTLRAAIHDAKFDMDNSTKLSELDAANIICQDRIREVEALAAEATTLVGQVDLIALGNIIDAVDVPTAAGIPTGADFPTTVESGAEITLETHQANIERTKNYLEMAVEYMKYTIACLTAYARYETNVSAIEYLRCRAHLIGGLDMDVVPDGHAEWLQKIEDEQRETRRAAQRVLIEAGDRLGFEVPFFPEEEEEADEEMDQWWDEEDEEQAGWEDDREWDDENGRWK